MIRRFMFGSGSLIRLDSQWGDWLEERYCARGQHIYYRCFRLRKGPAPLNSQRWKCNWLHCVHGMGLAGMGRCSAFGEWWNKDCPKFITNDDYEQEMKLRYEVQPMP